MFQWYRCLCDGRTGRFYFLAIRRSTTVQASFQSQSVISFWQMELMSFTALLLTFTVAQQKILRHSPGLSFQSWIELFLVQPLMPHHALDLSACPGLSLPRLKLSHRLVSAFQRLHCENFIFFALICIFLLTSHRQHAHAVLRRFSCCFQT